MWFEKIVQRIFFFKADCPLSISASPVVNAVTGTVMFPTGNVLGETMPF